MTAFSLEEIMKHILKHKVRSIISILCILMDAWFIADLIWTGNVFLLGSDTGIAVFTLLLLYMIFFEKINSAVSKMWKRIPGKIIISIVCLLLAFVLVLACATTGCMIAGVKNSIEGTDDQLTVVVLGCKVNGYYPSRSLELRLDKAYEFLTENEGYVCVVSGGQGEGEKISEAECMKDYLTKKGIDPDRIYLEDRSENTIENIDNSYEVIKENGLPEKIAIVTSSYHEYRAGLIAGKAGISEHMSVPARSPFISFSTDVVREMYGILNQWLFDGALSE